MKKTAEADDRISPEEKVLLDYIKDEYLKDTV
jgi:hypothetical protein